MGTTALQPVMSQAQIFLGLPVEERRTRIQSITDAGAEALLYDWEFWRRPNQIAPADLEWVGWMLLAGRGFGKTRVGVEQVREWIRTNPIVNLVGPTAADVRDVMIEGESGIIASLPKGERPRYYPSKARLVWPNGALSLLFSADEPDRMRGPQCYKAWCDEIAAWRYLEDAWDNLMFGLRLGMNPQWVATTTPKPLKLIRQLFRDPDVRVTSGSTYDNRANLADKFYKKVITKYEGTRLGRQELLAELLEDNPDALWPSRDVFDKYRVKAEEVPPLVRVVIPIDPAVSTTEDSADTGIVPVGRDARLPPHFYVLGDATCHESPDRWAKIARNQYMKHRADCIVGEVNNGGDLVEANIHHCDPNLPFKAVRASRGKLVRAEPIAALYEQGRVHHVGSLSVLEDQMCDYVPGAKSPDNMDACVWGLTELAGPEEFETEIVSGGDRTQISRDLDDLETSITSEFPDFAVSSW